MDESRMAGSENTEWRNKKRPGNGDSVYSYGKNQRVEKRNIFPESQILWKKI